jgi:asparagine N-glycosylation enzyme membrane subunit Stt3
VLSYRLHIGAAAVLTVLAAWHPYATVTSRPGARFQDSDACFHARRAMRAIESGALLPPVQDAFENFPEGGRAVWPPLHDAALAALARLGGSSRTEPARGMPVAAALPVLELVLALGVAAALARRTAGDWGGIAAAWLFASMPVLADRGAFGEIDHNLTEVLGALGLLYLAVRVAEARAHGSVRDSVLAAAWAAGLLAALGFHTGLILSAGVAGAGVALRALLARKERPPAVPLGRLALGFGLAALALPFLASLRVTPDPADPWRLGPVYALLLAFAGAGCGLAALVFDRTEGTWWLPAVGAAASAALLVLVPRAAWGAAGKGLGFLGARDPWLASIQEFQPIRTNPQALAEAAPGLLVGLVALGVVAAALRRREGSAFVLVPLAFAFVVLTLLAILQQRFIAPAAGFAAAFGGAGAGVLLAEKRWRFPLAGAFAAGLLFSVPPLARDLRATLRAEADLSLSAPEAVADVLTRLSPPPGDPPAWGVLAPWDYGHAVLLGSGRAVAVNNFGSWHPGFERKLALLVETSPAKALYELRRLRIRYVVVPYPPSVVYGIARALGRNPLDYLFDDGEKTEVRYRGTPQGERTLLFRLHRSDGAPFPADAAADRDALSAFRKVWQSPEEGKGIGPYLKIFEVMGSSG